ncbi:Oidioi.mRNA.OKI2018_I69.chr2.g6974.t1.cds [Oikopleura dioica]|uniref:Oidioi.mRNA.OKI2018_I69.chr2.g6974.t1.cds n=1 Tax=Oikopleura dioica TaxID=34765 RepID=A0ABN7T5B6_OIKDI|nr:Oidioi.mRNA.OKI2018_I69.chr2.g6974.t1.cds [Oikopleura dioica]
MADQVSNVLTAKNSVSVWNKQAASSARKRQVSNISVDADHMFGMRSRLSRASTSPTIFEDPPGKVNMF